jgi:SnoaL-like polyketide cyclase
VPPSLIVSFDIVDMSAENDKVVVRGTYSVIHDSGEWLSMTPTGNRVTETVIDIYRVEEEKIVEAWSEDSGSQQSEESLSTEVLRERPTSENLLSPMRRATRALWLPPCALRPPPLDARVRSPWRGSS